MKTKHEHSQSIPMEPTSKKSVTFSEDVLFEIPCRENKDHKREKCTTETLYETISHMRSLVKHLYLHFRDSKLPMTSRIEIIDKHIDPMVKILSDHSEIKELVVTVQDNEVKTNGKLSIHQVLYDFVRSMVCSFRENKLLTFVKDDYIEKKPYVSGKIHLSIGNYTPSPCENSIWINFNIENLHSPISYRTGE